MYGERGSMRKAFKYKIYPSKNQVALLEHQLSEACRLYNAAIQERSEAWKVAKKSISWYEQKRQLTEVRQAGDTGLINCGTGQQILKRVDLAFQAFFRRCKQGQSPGYPRFKSYRYFDSLPYQNWGNGCAMKGCKLYLQGIGNVKVRWHRPMEGKIKTLTVKREGGQWYAVFSVEYDAPPPMEPTGQSVGIDVGIKHFAAMSDGEVVDNPRYYETAQAELRRAQRVVSRRFKPGKKQSKGYYKAKDQVRDLHAKTANARDLFHHTVARSVVDNNDLIAVEDLNVKGLAKGTLAKQVNDAGWSHLIHCIEYKAAEAGRAFVKVNPRGTSQTCICGAAVPKKLSDRVHLCEKCGADENRDVMSAKVILQRALSSLKD